MASTTSVLSPPLSVGRSGHRALRVSAIALVVALLAVAGFAAIRTALDDHTTHNPAHAGAAQLNARFDTPEGRAALAHEFAPGYFGGGPGPATPAAQEIDPMGTAAQLNARFETPEDRAALAHEFAPGYFGGGPVAPAAPSQSTSSAVDTCRTVVRTAC